MWTTQLPETYSAVKDAFSYGMYDFFNDRTVLSMSLFRFHQNKIRDILCKEAEQDDNYISMTAFYADNQDIIDSLFEEEEMDYMDSLAELHGCTA